METGKDSIENIKKLFSHIVLKIKHNKHGQDWKFKATAIAGGPKQVKEQNSQKNYASMIHF